MRTWTKLAILALTALVVTQILLRRSEPTLALGERSPPLVLPDLEGRSVDLAALRGKVVAVNFWATWCGPCREEIPELAEVWRAHRGRCFELLGVAEESAREDVVRVAPEMPYPVLLDERAEALEPWSVRGYPRTYVVDAEGKLRHVFEGGMHRAELEAAIGPLLPTICPGS
jgi:cytochrome c biogenesis protein CcmG/thiol:disulfide interchange protein DsbE